MDNSSDDRSAMAQAMQWASRVTTVSLEMALPALAGHWADQRLATAPLLTIGGAVFGLALGMWHLIQMTRTSGDRPKKPRRKDESK